LALYFWRMNYPVFIYHELVFRCAAINKSIGKYISTSLENGEFLLNTSTGHLRVASAILEKQYYNPNLISVEELEQLTSSFKFQ
jgi:hypothetical protein